jgi:fibronectin type 3 domain-containing protein
VKIAEVPSTDSIYTDNVPIAMENYYYYLVLNGIMNQGYPSTKVGAHAINNEVPEPPDLFRTETVEGGVKIQWTHMNPEVRGYYIYRDQGRNGELKQVSEFIPAGGEIMTYIDSTEGLLGNLSYRYAVKAVNDGYIMSRLSEISSTRPGIPTSILPPTNLHGGMVNGNVLLVWDDMYRTNEFLLAYQLYKKRKGESDFEKITEDLIPFYQNTFMDTIHPEESGIYEYAVSSTDESGQESLLSSSIEIELKNPSLLVFAPAGLRIAKGTDGIEVIWAMDEDNKNRFQVFRYEAGEKAIKIAALPAGSFNYTDREVQKGKLYFYYVIAVTPDGRESEPSESAGMRY